MNLTDMKMTDMKLTDMRLTDMILFQRNAVSTYSQSIAEAMILFKGRSSLHQYMPLKPTKRGYKVWVSAD